MFKFQLGTQVKDTITRFTGVVTVRIDYITGSNRYGVQSTAFDKDGAPKKEVWYDEERLVLVDEKSE